MCIVICALVYMQAAARLRHASDADRARGDAAVLAGPGTDTPGGNYLGAIILNYGMRGAGDTAGHDHGA